MPSTCYILEITKITFLTSRSQIEVRQVSKQTYHTKRLHTAVKYAPREHWEKGGAQGGRTRREGDREVCREELALPWSKTWCPEWWSSSGKQAIQRRKTREGWNPSRGITTCRSAKVRNLRKCQGIHVAWTSWSRGWPLRNGWKWSFKRWHRIKLWWKTLFDKVMD